MEFEVLAAEEAVHELPTKTSTPELKGTRQRLRVIRLAKKGVSFESKVDPYAIIL